MAAPRKPRAKAPAGKTTPGGAKGTTEDTRRELALSNCAFYASEYLTGDPKPPYNGRFLISEHHQDWARKVNEHNRLCVLAARDSGKSFFFSKAVPLWLVEKNPWSGKGPQPEGLLFGASQPKVRKVMMKIMREVQTNPNLRHLDPKRYEKTKDNRWSADILEFANGFVLSAFGFDTRARGEHPIFAIIDDALTEEDAYSETVRERHIEYFNAAIEPMIPPDGRIIVVGTPFHYSDLYGSLRDNPEFEFKPYPAIIDVGKRTERALWPERYPLDVLARKKRIVGPLTFTREYLVDPVTDVASLFPRTLWNMPGARQPYKLGAYDWKMWRKAGIVKTVIGVDIALSNESGADFLVLFVVGVDKFGNRWVLDIIREGGLAFHLQLELIKKTHRRYRADMIFIESNQMQQVWRDELRRTTDLPVERFITTAEKHNLQKGLPSLRIGLENTKWRLPESDEKDAEDVVNIFLEEARAHSLKDGKVFTSAPHDDTVYAWYIADQAIEATNFGFAFESDEEDEEAFEAEMAELFGDGGDPSEDLADDEDDFGSEDEDLADAFIKAQPGYSKARQAILVDLEHDDLSGQWTRPQDRRGGPKSVKFTIHELAAGSVGQTSKRRGQKALPAPSSAPEPSLVQSVLRSMIGGILGRG